MPKSRANTNMDVNPTSQMVLEKAIQKAGASYIVKLNEHGQPLIGVEGVAKEHYTSWQALIFNHDFAKALWGETKCDTCDLLKWQAHLQQMVIAEDPIKYLGDNLNA